jgi:AmmeMemoRadiSam system protein B
MKNNSPEQFSIRHPIYAGSFYPADKDVLSGMIEDFLSGSKVKLPKGKRVRAIITPHAGYVYSGGVAAFAYKVLLSAKPKKIILFGPSHHKYLEDAYTFEGIWSTPLGEIKLTPADLPIIGGDKEHSLEVQLPFLQKVLKEFELTPIMYGDLPVEELADILNTEKNDESVLIASSDLSHYSPYAVAKKIDSNTIKSILELDFDSFSSDADACGKLGIQALMILAKKNNWKPILLSYKNSGDTAGDKNKVVGYASIAFFEEKK